MKRKGKMAKENGNVIDERKVMFLNLVFVSNTKLVYNFN